jgi:WD40 repeat protein
MKALVTAIAAVAISMVGCVTVTRVEPPTSVVAKADTGAWTDVTSLVFSSDGTTLAAASPVLRGRVRLWNVATWSEVPLEGPPLRSWPLEQTLATGTPVCFSQDGKILAVQMRDADAGTNGIALFSVATGRRITSLSLTPRRFVLSTSFSRNGATMLYVETEVFSLPIPRKIWVSEWDFASGKLLWTEGPVETDSAWSTKLSPEGRLLALVPGSWGHQRIELWDTTHRQLRATTEDLGYLRGPGDLVPEHGIVFSPDGQRIFVNSEGRGLIIESLNGKILYRFDYQQRTRLTSTRLYGLAPAAFSPDGRLLALGLPGEGVQVLDVTTGKMLSAVSESASPVSAHSETPSAIAFSPDGRTLAVMARGEIKQWEVARLIGTLQGG